MPTDVFRQGMTAVTTTAGGTPDYYYDLKHDLWVEYKALRQDDHFPRILPEDALPTPLQRQWLDRRFAAGGNAVVAVGLKLKGRVHGFLLENPEQWSTRHPLEWYQPKLLPVSQLLSKMLVRLA